MRPPRRARSHEELPSLHECGFCGETIAIWPNGDRVNAYEHDRWHDCRPKRSKQTIDQPRPPRGAA